MYYGHSLAEALGLWPLRTCRVFHPVPRPVAILEAYALLWWWNVGYCQDMSDFLFTYIVVMVERICGIQWRTIFRLDGVWIRRQLEKMQATEDCFLFVYRGWWWFLFRRELTFEFGGENKAVGTCDCGLCTAADEIRECNSLCVWELLWAVVHESISPLHSLYDFC